MNTPVIKNVSVQINYSCNDGYQSKESFNGTPEAPMDAIYYAIEELSRMAALYAGTGGANIAKKRMQLAFDRVEQWRNES